MGLQRINRTVGDYRPLGSKTIKTGAREERGVEPEKQCQGNCFIEKLVVQRLNRNTG